MNLRRFLAPLLGTLILAITGFFGAGVAIAHPGHVHALANGGAPSAQTSPVIEEVAFPAPLAAMVAVTVLEVEVAIAMSFDVAVSEAPDRDLADSRCIGMCCDNAPCGGCVKIAFGKLSLPAPLFHAWLPVSAEARKLTGRLAEGPNKPPRTFI